MKKVTLIFTVAIVALLAVYSFSTIDKYPDNVPEENVAMFKSEYLKTINSNDLNMQLEQNFLPLFDKVHYVVAKYHENVGYYYDVFGTKNGLDVNQGLKIERSDIENETYTYIDFANIKVNEFTVYCKDDVSKPECDCTPPPPVKACKIICAVWTGEICFPPL